MANWFSFHGLDHIGVMLFFVFKWLFVSLPFKKGGFFVNYCEALFSKFGAISSFPQ